MKSLIYRLSIRQKIIVILSLFAGLLIVTLTALDIYNLRIENREEYVSGLELSRSIFDSHVAGVFKLVEGTAKNIQKQPRFMSGIQSGDLERIQNIFDFAVQRVSLDGAALISHDGKIIVYATQRFEFDAALFESLLSGMQPVLDPYTDLVVVQDAFLREIAVLAIEPVQDPAGTYAAVMILKSLDNDFCDGVGEATGVNCTIWAGETRYASTDVDDEGKRIIFIPTDPDVFKRVYGDGDTVLVEADLLSKRDWALISPMTDGRGVRIGMAGFGKDARELAVKQWIIIRKRILTALVVLILIVFLSLLLARTLTAPVESFQKMAAAISVGNYNLPDFLITGKDEINGLKTSFNRMLHEIRVRTEKEAAHQRAQAMRLFELSVLNDIATAVNVNQDLDVNLRLILTKTGEAVGAGKGAVVLTDDRGDIAKRIFIGFQPADDRLSAYLDFLLNKISGEKKEMILPCSDYTAGAEYLKEQDCTAAFCIPLMVQDRMTGIICLLLDRSHESFSEAQQRVISIVAAQSVRVIENARLYQAEQEKEYLEREMQLAHDIQTRLLSTISPAIQKFEIAAHNAPSREVGGDYYDVIPIDDGRIAVAIGDVSGKGVSAALLMANLQAAVRALAAERHDLDVLVSKINHLIFRNTDASKFITFFIGIINVNTGNIEFVNAGHNPPLLYHTNGSSDGAVERLEGGGPILGVMDDIAFAKGFRKIEKDDVLLLYTDGVTEAMNRQEEEYGEERLIRQIRSLRTGTVSDIQQAILMSVDNFRQNAPQEDDITLLVVKRTDA